MGRHARPEVPVFWQVDAACRDADPDLFFGYEGEPRDARILREQRAKAICSACPVAAECLRWAVTTGERMGIWGGTTEDERSTLRRGTAQRARTSLAV